jgi:sec-independent protein translocase protein TatB
MFDIGWSEFVVIGVVALIVIGPKELPAVLRAIGQWTTKIRRMAGEFQSQFQEAMREAEMADLKKQVDELGDAAKGLASDPLDFKEATKWEPKTDSAANTTPDAASTPASETPGPEPASAAAPEPAAVEDPSTQTSAPQASSSQTSDAAPAPDAGASSDPQPAVTVVEGSGR